MTFIETRGNDGVKPAEIAGATLTIRGLGKGRYRVEWWHTWQGKPLGAAEATATGEALALKVPTFTRDIACKVARQE